MPYIPGGGTGTTGSTVPITVTGVLEVTTGQFNPGWVIATLCNYGNNVPRVAGTAIIVQPEQKVIANANGGWSIQLWNNDGINPPNTFYTFQFYNSLGGLVGEAAYQLNGSGTFDISNLTPLSAQATIPVYNAVLLNPTASQTIMNYALQVPQLLIGTLSDLGLTRPAAGVLAVGNGVLGDFSGTVKAAKFLLNDGTAAAPALAFTNNTGSGLYNVSGTIAFAVGGAIKAFVNGNINLATNAGMYTFGATQDTGLSRTAAAEVSVGNGTAGNSGGTLIANQLKGGTLFSINAAGLIVMGSLSDAGLSRGAAAQVNVGNGTASDASGSLYALILRAVSAGGVPKFTVNASTPLMKLGNDTPFGFSSTADATGSADVAISRPAAGVLAVGNGTQSDFSATLKCGNAILTTATPTVAAGQVGFGNSTAGTATAGAGTLPANPDGFLIINVAGTTKKIPYYQN